MDFISWLPQTLSFVFGGDDPLLQPPLKGTVSMIGLVIDACFVYKQLRYRYEHSNLVAELAVRLSGRSRSTVSGKQNVDFLYEEKLLLQE
jgi:hypothetical protein